MSACELLLADGPSVSLVKDFKPPNGGIRRSMVISVGRRLWRSKRSATRSAYRSSRPAELAARLSWPEVPRRLAVVLLVGRHQRTLDEAGVAVYHLGGMSLGPIPEELQLQVAAKFHVARNLHTPGALGHQDG